MFNAMDYPAPAIFKSLEVVFQDIIAANDFCLRGENMNTNVSDCSDFVNKVRNNVKERGNIFFLKEHFIY